jgi:hypothetical protein
VAGRGILRFDVFVLRIIFEFPSKSEATEEKRDGNSGGNEKVDGIKKHCARRKLLWILRSAID